MVKCEICRYNNQRDSYSSHCIKCTDYNQFKAVTNFQSIKEMAQEEVAQYIILKANIDEKYCKCDCGNQNSCPHEMECALRWLDEEVSK